MKQVLSNTWAVVALLAVVIASLTALAIAHIIPATDVVKVVSGVLGGAALAWLRGTLAAQAKEAVVPDLVEEPTPPPKTPPVLPLLMFCFVLCLPGCAAFKSVEPVVYPTLRAIAEAWCAKYETKSGLSESDAKTLCATEKVIAPWLQLVLAGQKNGVSKTGAVKCENPDAQPDSGASQVK